MKKILIINGVNLNLQGKREVQIYGNQSFEEYLLSLKQHFSTYNIEIDYFQSNSEKEIVERIHRCNSFDSLIINAGAFSHTSLAIADAIRATNIIAIEVHISNIYNREIIRKKSLLSSCCKGSICGFGLDGYRLAIEHIIK